jgi:co-chaperonin GroES (HSP10)
MLKPRAGKALVKRIETEDTLPEGKVVLLEDTKNKMTSGQFEIVALGGALPCTDYDNCERPHDEGDFHVQQAKEGDWVLLAPRSLIATDDSSLFLVSQDDVLALLSE